MAKGFTIYAVILVVIVFGTAMYIDQRFMPGYTAEEFIKTYKTLQDSELLDNQKIFPKAEKRNTKLNSRILEYKITDKKFEKFYFKWKPVDKKHELPIAKIYYKIKLEKGGFYGPTEKTYRFDIENRSPNNPFKPDWVILNFVKERER